MRPKLALAPSAALAAPIIMEPLAALTNPGVMHWEATQKVSEGIGKFWGVRTRLTPM